ncbi:MAG: ABC transporter ATP-binding protein [Haliscomenobacter sp.]|nr:ABC transporter ATP-binding protein [Haliscomenobacter sp.]
MRLSIQNLTKQYPNGVKAIDHVSLELGPGMFGLLGPNGAGKSSLMRTIATLQKPDSGNVYFNEIDIAKDPLSLRKTLGYLPQEFGVYPNESAERLLHYFALLKGIASKKERHAKVEEVLQLTNLYEARKKDVSSYSGGMRQRFGIAQLLLNNPALIIVDEPTAGLDPAERNRFLNVLREIGTKNIVLFSTHLVEDVNELCTEMAIMNHGKIQKRSAPSQAKQALEGKIWTKRIPPAELEFYKTAYLYLSSSFNEDHTVTVRVYADTLPEASFVPAENVTLDDVYFNVLGQTVQANA